MFRPARLEGVLCLTLDNPPLNIFESRVYTALYDALGAAETEESITAVVLAAEGRLFSAGGNIQELGLPVAPGEADIVTVVNRIAAFRKPIGIALHGKAIGASVIMALACDVRVGLADTTITLPEVHLGFVPRGGTIQRLLRLAGIPVTVDMIALGRPLDAATAFQVGIIDDVVEGPADRVALAVDRVRALSRDPQGRRNLAAGPVLPLGPGQSLDELFSRSRERARDLFPALTAPHLAMDLIRSSIACDFAEGISLEKQAYERMFRSDESVMLRSKMLKKKARPDA